ncbi:hypothetical protein QTO34_015022 [Cnephaeus nilssonii]|uniref:Gag-pol polyprotein n=1 Tax=Cnephaeus nilssonii TaxID=3371016 RepID=A0AA40I3C1_CNENI|nr:hypothetical protein QTO34_015022 [Eptesicus nilssonii]
MVAYRTYTPMDPEAPQNRAAVAMSFINQSAADIRKKLQKIDRLGEKSLRDLLEVAEKVYNNRESPEDRQARAMAAASDKQTRNLAKILLATTTDPLRSDSPPLPACGRPRRRVTLRMEGTPVDFLVDTGAQHSFLRTPQGKLANKKSWVQGATGMSQYSWTTRRTVVLGTGWVSHSFMRLKANLLFAFEWHDPEEGYSGQLTWTRLPQGFKNSPTIFDEALHEDLGEYRREQPSITLLQYVDDILIAADTAEDCEQGTRDLLATLGTLGYQASAKKAQICREDERKGIAKGVLTQALGPWSRPVAYLSKKLDPVAAGLAAYLRIIAATALLSQGCQQTDPRTGDLGHNPTCH